MRKLLQTLLAFFARRIIQKYKPKIIGITGSVGKTSANEAVFCVVSTKYKARRSEKNYNNEIGLPLTIIGVDSPGKNVIGWIIVFLKALSLVIFTNKYVDVLVLEYGIDRVGNMDYLLRIAKPDIGIITSIGLSHYEFFKNEEIIEREKGKMSEILEPDDWLIVNADDERSERQKLKTRANKISYGVTNSNANIRLINFEEQYFPKTQTTGKILALDKEIHFNLKAVGFPHLSAVLAGVAVSEALGIEIDLIQTGIGSYKPAPGRLNLIAGIKKSILIDDTYNAAPDSTRESLMLLRKIPGKNKMAVLGDMLELGTKSEEAHLQIGKLVKELNFDKLITIGSEGKIIAEGARVSGFPEDKITSFNTSDEAMRFIQEAMEPESIVLIKGSQGVRMEKITKEIMAEPVRASELLCRQYGNWLN